jgi:tol-pal system protein YbgF
MKQIITTASVLALLTGSATPSAAQNREHQQQAAELRILQEQQVQLALAIAQLTQSLTEAIKGLNSRIDQTNDRIIKGFADQTLGIKGIENNVSIIRQNSQETATRLGELKNEIEALRRDLTSMMARMLTAAPAAPLDPLDPNALPPGAPVANVPLSTPPPPSIGLSPQVAYQTAYADFTSGQFAAAVEGFREYLRNFPTYERAADAQYHIGEAEYSQNRFEEAVAAYDLVIQNYPKSEQVPWAYYKRGLAQGRLGRIDEQRASLEQAAKFPNAPAAILAKSRLDGLSRIPAPAAQKP